MTFHQTTAPVNAAVLNGISKALLPLVACALGLALASSPALGQSRGQVEVEGRSGGTNPSQTEGEALRRRVSVQLDEASVEEAVQIIAREADLEFAYLRRAIAVEKRVSLRADEISVREAFREVLQGTGLEVALVPGTELIWVRASDAGAAVHSPEQERRGIVGRVTDAETGEPLPGVNVFLSGTTYGSATDSTGRYAIRGAAPGTYDLVASMVGYEAASTQVTVEQDRSTIRHDFVLSPVAYELAEVRVEADRPPHWEDRFEAFHALFVGPSDQAEQVRITNHYALSFEQEYVGHGQVRLAASADRPLRIENRHLGYHMTFVLNRFEANEKTEQLRYDGYSYFEEMEPANAREAARWKAARAEALLGSEQHFLWALTHGRLREEGFDLRHGHPPVDDEAQPYVAGPVTSHAILRATDEPYLFQVEFDGFLRLVYERPGSSRRSIPAAKEVTWLKMARSTGQVHEEGWLLPPVPITYYGALGRRRMAVRLPNDYVDATRGRESATHSPETAIRHAAESSAQPTIGTRRPSAPARNAYELVYSPWTAKAPGLQPALQAMRDGRWRKARGRLGDYLGEHPEDLTARYLRGVATRHLALQAKFRGLDFWNRGIEDLNQVLARDSTFRDALAQKALFSALAFPRSDIRWHDNISPRQAIAMARRQIALRPDLPEARLALIRLYEQLLREEQLGETLNWLRRPGAQGLDRYFAAEALRRAGRLREADRMLAWLQEQRPPEVPATLLALGRVRVAADQERPSTAHDHMTAAIDGITSSLDAALLFEEVKYIARPEELEAYRSMRAPAAYRRFFDAYWIKRHPALGAPVNPRIATHFQRLDEARERFAYRGPRGWHDAPKLLRAGLLEMPSTYRLNDDLNDKGLVFVRHGPPDDRLSASEFGLDANESWRYNDPPMDFHFFRILARNNWRLAPGLVDVDPFTADPARKGRTQPLAGDAPPAFEREVPAIIESRSVWGGIYTRLRRGDWTAQTDLAQAAQEWVDVGLTTDQPQEIPSDEALAVPHLISAFRGDGGQTEIVVDYAFPIGQVSAALPAVRPARTGTEAGVALYDTTWDRVAGQQRQGLTSTASDPTAAAPGRFALTVVPGSYQLGLYAKAPATGQVGSQRSAYDVPDFSGSALQVSDLVLAYSVRPAQAGEALGRDAFSIQANPTGRFRSNQPVSLYVEIYNLAFGASDRTRHTIEYALVPEEGGGNVLTRLLGRGDDRAALSVESTTEGSETAPIEYVELDVASVEPGRYALVATVTDEHTGQTAETRRTIEIVAAAR